MPKESQRIETPAGTEVVIDRPAGGAPTILIDGLGGVALSNNLIKIDLYEQLILAREDGKASGRHVVTLAMPVESFLKVTSALQDVVNQHLAPRVEAE